VEIIKQRALEINAIKDYTRNLTIEAPETLYQIYERLKDQVKGYTQVRDQLFYLHTRTKVLGRIREGKEYKYWWIGNMKTPEAPKLNTAVLEETGTTIIGKTEIHVGPDSIVIENAKCRVIVELK